MCETSSIPPELTSPGTFEWTNCKEKKTYKECKVTCEGNSKAEKYAVRCDLTSGVWRIAKGTVPYCGAPEPPKPGCEDETIDEEFISPGGNSWTCEEGKKDRVCTAVCDDGSSSDNFKIKCKYSKPGRWQKASKKASVPLCGAEGPKICHEDDIPAELSPAGVIWDCTANSKQNICIATCANGAHNDQKKYALKCQNKKNTWGKEKKKMVMIEC